MLLYDRGYPAFRLFISHAVVLAKLLTLILTAILVWVAQWMTTRLARERRRDYQVNVANALSKLQDNVVRMLSPEPPPDLHRTAPLRHGTGGGGDPARTVVPA